MRKLRILLSKSGTITDFTTDLHKWRSGEKSFNLEAANDYIYIGNLAPFNHLYFKMGTTVNTASSSITVQYYTGREWKDAVETIDETEGFTKDGYIEFVPDRERTWTYRDTDEIDALSAVTIYDLFWVRLKFSNDLDPGSTLRWVGNLFSNDEDLNAEYPDLNRSNVITAYEAGKTDWEEQHVKAGELIVKDLLAKKIIFNAGQILDRSIFTLASVAKVAEIIFTAFGDDYADDKQRARQEFQSRMNLSQFNVDRDLDGDLSPGEVVIRSGFAKR